MVQHDETPCCWHSCKKALTLLEDTLGTPHIDKYMATIIMQAVFSAEEQMGFKFGDVVRDNASNMKNARAIGELVISGLAFG